MVTHTRDAEAMRERIMKALGRIIVRDGLGAVGINALAREVGCDKVLIYRYFGDLGGVYAAFAAQGDFWWSVAELTEGTVPGKTSLAQAVKRILRRHAHAIRSRPITLAVLASELVERTELVVALEKIRERRSLELSAWIAQNFHLPASVDFDVIALILGVAINYLAARARKIKVMSGIPIKNDEDWERLHTGMDGMIDRIIGS